MRPFARAAFAAAILGAGLVGAAAVTPEDAAGLYPSNSAVTIAALAVAAFALGVAAYALVRLDRLAGEFRRFARSADITLSRLSTRSEGQADAIAVLEDRLDRQVDGSAGDGTAAAACEERPQNVVPHPSSQRARKAELALARKRGEAAESALARAVAEESLELSLQPIVSVSANAAKGFETFVHLELEDDNGEDIYRLSADARGIDAASLERLRVARAAETARRRLGTKADNMPLHCAISEALLDDADASARTIELLSSYPVLARCLILSVPTAVLRDETPARRQRLSDLLSTGIAFAAEGWDDPVAELAGMRDLGVVYLKVDANRLLDREKSRRRKPSGLEIVTAAADCGILPIACGIESDEDAVNLLDLGVDLMVGNRFSEPKRLRSAGDAAGRVA